ncbi:MAG: prolyl oligopeptidase family serine peptidase [Candidatus Moranbacteria bacterium]|nr:prolyl oligopeptidase family serine peptidase [Candidatus Moranbacteria bacterium]
MKIFIKSFLILCSGIFIITVLVTFTRNETDTKKETSLPSETTKVESIEEKERSNSQLHPMSIEALRRREYLGGSFTIEQELSNGTNYRQFVASYKSEGLKIYGLLTVPLSPRPENGYPAIVFVHGHIPPKQYSTTGSYPTYQTTLARSGMITFKPDLRGHGRSEGEAVSAHYSEKYVVDTLYAIAYLKNYRDVDPEKLGYWGHSNGGEIGLRTAVISKDIKAYVFWAGVVGSFEDMLETYNDKIPFLRNIDDNPLVEEYGFPSNNQEFWKKLDPYSYLNDISAPLQLHHGTNDSSVPIELSVQLKKALESAGKKVEYFEYTGDDHNIGSQSGTAWQRSIQFFKKNL